MAKKGKIKKKIRCGNFSYQKSNLFLFSNVYVGWSTKITQNIAILKNKLNMQFFSYL